MSHDARSTQPVPPLRQVPVPSQTREASGKAAEPAIVVRGLNHTYPGNSSKPVILDMSFGVDHAEVVCVLGPSGSGKTTLLKVIAGLLNPTSGSASVAGAPAAHARRERRSGMLFQNPILFPWLTVGENILLPLKLRATRQQFGDLAATERESMARAAASLVGLSDSWRAFPHQLSGGMRARAALARALTYRPTILLLDEPFSSLDEITRAKLNDDVFDLQRATRATLLVVTHSVEEAAYLADRVLVLAPCPATIHAEMKSPAPDDRKDWRESTAFFHFCRELRGALVR